uniref:Uncharacterized protein n=1 Tax=Anguilla anguilla TaxID=7936 RepID=A0A0E9P5V3_ANGAN
MRSFASLLSRKIVFGIVFPNFAAILPRRAFGRISRTVSMYSSPCEAFTSIGALNLLF